MKKSMSFIMCLFIVWIQMFQLCYSANTSFGGIIAIGLGMLSLSFSVTALINLLLWTIIRNATLSFGISSVVMTLYSVINYYVTLYHGSPIFFNEFRSALTAFDVANSYKLEIDKNVILLVGFFALELVILIVKACRDNECEKGRTFCFTKLTVKKSIALLASIMLLSLYCYIGIFSPFSKIPQNAIGWSWVPAVSSYGYINCLLNNVQAIVTPYEKPVGYSSEIIDTMSVSVTRDESSFTDVEKPDIILILNETFCDLRDYSDVDADFSFMDEFYNIDGAYYGRAFVPGIGGGTNNSEYELLTSNSMKLLSMSAPFTYIDFTKCTNNLPNYMNRLGYDTYGMHCRAASNYSRNTAYPALGFDYVFLGQDYFTYSENGNRPWIDKDNYLDLINWYEAGGESPKFMYLLTAENHGGYEQNDDLDDTVHIENDYGNLTDDINEYLSSLKDSVDGFRYLVEYFRNQNHPVIICMVGDHAPSFISELNPCCEMNLIEKELAMREVPLIIWSNYGIEIDEDISSLSMTDVVPVLISAARLPMSTYYNCILELHELLPVHTGAGYYIDAAGNKGLLENSDIDVSKQLLDYYYMEYNSLIVGNKYREDLFIP